VELSSTKTIVWFVELFDPVCSIVSLGFLQTIPNEDRLVPQLQVSRSMLHSCPRDLGVIYSINFQRAWNECLRTFDAGHVVIVSNSAGTREDVSGLEVRADHVNEVFLK
jgi:Mitochondrial PGP phosphatase